MRLNDKYQQPLTPSGSDDVKIKFLDKMLNWLEAWKKSDQFPKTLTSHITQFMVC